MWDVGSQINALMAAVDIGLIEENEFRRNISRILDNIRGRAVGDRLLPYEWIKTSKYRSGNYDFDGSDAGRLLAALHRLKMHSLWDGKTVEKLVKNWTFDAVIQDGEIMSIKNGEFVTSYYSHSAHYAALAFRKWGYDVASPYETFDGPLRWDGKMALLGAASEIGPMGAEPLLLEGVDFGLSAPSQYLSDVLFGAQLREYEISGDLICVSEGPIDQPPWFTYQGLNMSGPDRDWFIDTVDHKEKYLNPKFQKDNRVISSKAAFLWSATNPHWFSRKLVDYIRQHGRTAIGFASSIYSKTDTPTRDYTDINTNGIILQAVAEILKKNPRSG